MQTLTEIRALLAAHSATPRHRLGQNFLHDHNQIRKLLTAAEVSRGAVVLEIGPGTGTLTEELVAAGASVVACEIDPMMASIVESRIGRAIVLVQGDCLDHGRDLNPQIVAALAERPFKLVANLPYQVASPVIAILVTSPACEGQFVTIQKEVADRLAAPPGGKDYGPLGILVQAMAHVELIGVVPPGCFWPSPEVTSAMVAIRRRNEPLVADPHEFSAFLATVFSKRRKQLGSILGRDSRWPDGVKPEMRPETLSIEQLVALSKSTQGRIR